jgi:hypothetical protein
VAAACDCNGDTKMIEKIYEVSPESRIKLGKRRSRLLQDVENDLRDLKVKIWKKTANNRQ